ncbi:polysaccharide deacetylase family protein [Deinococcus irradiatisoli]|uniref:polysaccharide deacetylase family protein n=1 Tax=Deinococcus irradiatisoli TaxID=2202254 RepID=UPI0015E87211|nr:polysaccharide deacetylase family protein [Deinococcus irradiatisoli]
MLQNSGSHDIGPKSWLRFTLAAVSGALLLSACGSTSSGPTPSTAECLQAAGNSAVTFVADDGYQQDWTILRPIFKEAGVPFVSAVITNSIGHASNTSLDQIKQLAADGDEIVSHTVTHPDLNTLNDAMLDAELKDSQAALAAAGLPTNHVVYPMGDTSERVEQAASKYYQLGVGVGNGLNDPKALERYDLHRVALGSYFDVIPSSPPHPPTNTLAYYKARIDEAVQTHQWLIFMLHSAGPGFDEAQVEALKDTVAYAKTQNTNVTTLSGGYAVAQKLAACK